MKNVAAGVAFRAGRWPIHTLALISTLVFVMYVVVVELNPTALPRTLARTYEFRSISDWVPLTGSGSMNLPHFVGAPVVFPTSASAAVKQHVESLLGASSSKGNELFGDRPKIVMPSSQLTKFLDELHVFEVDGQSWELQSAPSWIVYSRFYGERIFDLMRTASWFDISVVSLGWAGMYYTFFQLYKQLRILGSQTFLFLAALMSSGLAFLSAYAVTVLAGINVPKLALVQGLPFFVLAVGFNDKVALARESLLNPERLGAADAVRLSVRKLFGGFLRESLFEALGMILAGCATAIPGLREFSILSSIILFLDLLFLITFFAANVSLKVAMVQVERNDAVRRALQEDGVSRDVAGAYADEVSQSSNKARAAKFTHFKWIGGSVRLLAVFGLIAINWLQIVKFPISFTVDRNDLTALQISEFTSRLPLPCIFTIVPAMRFSPVSRGSWLLNHVLSLVHSAPATRVIIVALILSLFCNGYLAGLVMHQGSTTPILVEVKAETESPAVITRYVIDKPSSVGDELAEPSTASSVASLTKESYPASATRTIEESEALLKKGLAPSLTNEELISLSISGKLPLYALEKQLKDTTRAVIVRRAAVSRLSSTKTLESSELPYKSYNYDRVLGACCENVIGYLPLPLGVAGPVIIDGKEYYLPMATTEGVLVASTMRGCKALNAGGGVTTEILADGMTRGPCVTFGTASRAAKCKIYLDSAEGRQAMERAFNSTSRFAKLDSLKTAQAGVFLYIRFRAQTGDAMGMNMISKGTERALQVLAEECGFEDMTIVSVSGNYCTDKKAAAVNWIEGRGKSVVAEAIVPGNTVKKILKTGVDELVELNMAKNLVGSSVAGVLGGFNAHAANLVAAMFLATGQDPAQVVEGSNCMTLMSNVEGDLQISVTMPSLEVGTIGGGTILEPQAAMLNMLGVRGPHISQPGENARQLARIIATAVLAGELSLNSALAAGHLVQSHMAHNRAKPAPAN